MASIEKIASSQPPPWEEPESTKENRILILWDKFFKTFKEMPSCEFVQYHWKISKSVVNLEVTKKVESVYKALIIKVSASSDLKFFLDLHRQGTGMGTLQTVEAVYSTIERMEDPNAGRRSWREKGQDALVLHLLFTMGKDRSDRNQLTEIFFKLLETDFSDRLASLETKIKTILNDEILPNSSQDEMIDGSHEIQEGLASISLIFIQLNDFMRKEAESFNLAILKKAFEEKHYLPHFEGTVEEWISDLEKNPDKLNKVDFLDLHALSLSYLPPRFTSLPFRNLKQVNLSYNALRFLPEPERFFSSSKNIIFFKLSHNKLKTLPVELLSHCDLQVFEIDYNLIEYLPGIGKRWTSLKRFSCSDNAIFEVSPDFGKTWTVCEAVDLQDNRIHRNMRALATLKGNLPMKVDLKASNLDDFSHDKAIPEDLHV